jgi:CSLREA domain-containing protein
LAVLNPTSGALEFLTYIGGTGADTAIGVVLDSAKRPVVVGRTASSNLATTAGAYDTTANGLNDGFVYRSAAIPPLVDADGDGLWDSREDANSDADTNPATIPGPDTDGDTIPNYLDPDDDGDGTPTAAENADPNGDGDPRDAVDIDRDGEADYLDRPTVSSTGRVTSERKISDTTGGLLATIDDADQFGVSAVPIGDLDGDGTTDVAVGAEFDDDGGSNRGAVYILFLNPDGTVRAEQKISDTQGGLVDPLADGDSFGFSVGGVGDLDGDGTNDLAVSARYADDGGINRGAIHILFLNPNGTVKDEQTISDTQGGLVTTLDDSDQFGVALRSLGDLDADGINDLAVASWGDDDGGSNRGAVYILFLNADGTVRAEQKISDTQGGLAALIDNDDHFGESLAGIGDLDGDGILDLAAGAYDDDDGGSSRGAVYILFLNANGTVRAEQKISSTTGGLTATIDNDDQLGIGLGSVGDVDGDGNVDVVAGTWGDDDGGTDRGSAYVLFLNSNGTVKRNQKISSTTGGLTGPLDNSDTFGRSVHGLGDFDGNGVIDLLVGAHRDDDGGSNRGAIYLLGLEPDFCAIDSDGDGLWDCQEDANSDADNDPATSPGRDTDGDALANYLDADDDSDGTPTAAENADPNGDGDPRDAVDSDRDGQPDYLDRPTGKGIPRVAAEQKISDTQGGLIAPLDDGDEFGTDVASIGDIDGDGIVDLAVGADGDSDGGMSRGAVYILFLNANGTVRAEQKISDTQGGLTAALDDDDNLGVAVGGIGDVDGDGIPDIAVGARGDGDGGPETGAVYILFLNVNGTVKAEQKLSDTQGGLAALLDDFDNFGVAVSGIGDLDGDGIPDIAVGASGDDDGGAARGAVHIVFLNANGTAKAEQKLSDTQGGFAAPLDNADIFGYSVGGIGDVDGDGISDIAVGASGDDDGGAERGAVHIVFLNANGTVRAEQKISDTQGGFAAPLDNFDYFGMAVGGVGDVDGDRIPDVAVGAPSDSDGGLEHGAIYILLLNANGTVRAEQKVSDTQGGFTSPLDETDFFGTAVGGIGDLDGDGTIGLAVGTFGDDDGGTDRGAVYILDLEVGAFVVNSTLDADDSDPGDGVCATGATNSEADMACTLRAALTEANAAPNANRIEFDIPSTEPGYTSGTGVWTIAMPTSLLSITAPVEIVGATQTTNRGDTNPGTRGATRAVGTGPDGVHGTGDELMVDGVPAPEVELDFDGQGFRIESNAVQITGLAVFGGNSDFWIGSGTGAVISDNLIGSRASSFADPGPALRSNGSGGVVVAGSSGASVVDNVIGFQNLRGIHIVGVNDNVTVSGNEITSSGLAGGYEGGGIEIPNFWATGSDLDGAVITGNLIIGTIADLGIEVATDTLDTGIVIENNSVLGNGVLVYGNQNADGGMLRHNEIRNANTTGITIGDVVGWSILENSITNSAGGGIDLMAGGNGELAAPTIDAVATGYGVIEFDVTVNRAAGNYRIEFFSNTSPGPSGFGEGERFLGSTTIAHPGGVAAYTATVPEAPGAYAAATLTVDEGAGEFGSTSEFSNSRALTCRDTDGDGLCDEHEDANTDLDDDPATSPGPNSDGDALADYLDADDDGDGTPTADENADPNGDGDPRDAVDTDRDGEPEYLDLPTGPTTGRVADEQKISDLAGGLAATFDDSDFFGRSVASIGDVDNDGTVDVAVGAYGDDDGGPDRGALHIVFLNPDGTVKDEQKISSTIGGFIGPLGNFDYFGWSATGIGDIDGDGTVDLAVGAIFDDDGGGVRGAVHIVFLNPDGTVKDDQKISDTQGGFVGVLDNSDNFGGSVAGIGDLDGDGIGDLAVGANGDDDGGTNRGAAYIVFLNPDGTVKAEQKISHTQGGLAGALDDGDNLGGSVAGVGDLDGDGIVDLVVGATADDDGGADRGAIYVLFLNADGTVRAQQKISDLVGGLAATFDNSDQFGISVAGVGDLNGDGTLDLAVGANLDDDGGLNRGAAHLLFLNTNGTVKAERKISSTSGGFAGPLDNSDLFAISLVGLGDLDGDGVTDLAVGASFDDDGGSNRGAIYVLSLESDPTVVVNSTGDAADLLPSDRRCDTGGTNSTGQPECTLRAAISHAIASGSQFAIQFAIPASDPGHTAGVWRITPSTALPTITAAMSIDARTQPGFTSTPVVEIYGAGVVADGLLLGAASNSVMIRGLAMGGFTSNDIEVRGNGHLIAGNHFGVTADGATPFPINTAGTALRVEQGTGTTIGGASAGDGNVITNAGAAGITILGGAHRVSGNSIIGNAGIGIDVGGDGVTTPDPGDVDGVLNQPQLLGAVESVNDSAVIAVFDAAVGNYIIEYFDNPGGTDPTGYGEGQKLIAVVPVSVTAPGRLVLRHVVPGTGLDLTATATSVSTSATSEFSNAISSVAGATAAVADVSIRRSDLASVGGATTTVSGPTGPAFDLDGVGDMYVGPALDVTDGTLELRSSIRLDSTVGNPVVISKRATSGVVIYELGVDSATGRAVAAVRLSGSLVTASGGTLNTGSWHHLDAVWDGIELMLYVDGTEVDRVAAAGNLATDVATRMIVGARDDGTRRLDGTIDNVHVGHDPSSAADVAVRHTNRVGPSLLTVGAEQTNTAGSWTTTGAQSRSGSSALSAPATAGSESPAWAVATGIDEPGLVFESWWWISQSSDLDLASGTRAGSTPVDQYSSGGVDTPFSWELRRQRGDSTSVDGVVAATPVTGAWFEVEMWTDQAGNTRLLIDGAEVIGWTPQGHALTSGSAGLLVNRLPAGQSWYVDDARVRKLVMPEPVISLGPLDRK